MCMTTEDGVLEVQVCETLELSNQLKCFGRTVDELVEVLSSPCVTLLQTHTHKSRDVPQDYSTQANNVFLVVFNDRSPTAFVHSIPGIDERNQLVQCRGERFLVGVGMESPYDNLRDGCGDSIIGFVEVECDVVEVREATCAFEE